jgi:hypothetical protein
MKMSEVFQIHCNQCGKEASEGENQHHAETLAKGENFVQRPGRWLCSDCAWVKEMRTTSADHYEQKGVKKI